MSLKTELIAEGTVQRITQREVTVKATGEKLTFTNVLILGAATMVEAQLGRDLAAPERGAKVKARVEIGVYRDDDSVTLTEWLA